MFVFQFPFPFARLIGCLTRSVRFDLQRLRCPPLSLSFSLPFIMQSANLSNRLQIDKLSTAISVCVSPNSSSSLWAPHAFKATLQMLCFCFIFYSLFETCLTTRTTALLIPCLAYGIWHTHDIDATYSALDR